jgi:hypothetical protein
MSASGCFATKAARTICTVAIFIIGIAGLALAQVDVTVRDLSQTPGKLSTDSSVGALSTVLNSSSPGTHDAVDANSGVSSETEKKESSLQEVKATIDSAGATLGRLTSAQRRKWERATAALPAFCHDWDRMLHDRELNNLAHLQWHERGGYETAIYTGYGKVQSCQAKESDEGVPIGKVIYQEMSYYLVGKTIDDAKTHPKVIGTTNTLEIFSWEKDRWFY